MTTRTLSAALAMTMLVACSQGQKARNMEIKTAMDSVSYAIGADIGSNLKRGKIDSLNVDIVAMGLQDGLDSAMKLDETAMRNVMQAFMMRMQTKRQAEEQALAEENRVAGEKFLAENGKRTGVVTTPSGLQYEVVVAGSGTKPVGTDVVSVHYHGTFSNGEMFDSSVERGEPAELAVSQWIPGFVEALQLMPVGSKWKLYIPSELAYGPAGSGDRIPPNSVLVFDLELLRIVK